MARVDWTRMAGDDVEAIVGMFICSDFPNAVRVGPTQDDGGVDIFVPGPRGFAEQRAVFQVRKFSSDLTDSQKRDIARSFNDVVAMSKEDGWTVLEWHLVMPIDLTEHNLANWLSDLTKDAEFPCSAMGLSYCDTRAAQHPKVVDYYADDGKERLQSAMNNLAAIIARRDHSDRRRGEPLRPADVMSDLTSICKTLNDSDPFCRYDIAVSDSPPPADPADEPGLIGVHAVCVDSIWVTIKIFTLSSVVLQESRDRLAYSMAILGSSAG